MVIVHKRDACARFKSITSALAAVAALMLTLPVGVRAQSRSQPGTSTGLRSAGEVIAQYVAALGGETALRRQRSRHTVAELELQKQGLKGKLESWALAPDNIVIQTFLPGLGTREVGFDGKTVWVAAGGNAVVLAGKEAEQVRSMADFYLPLHGKLKSVNMRAQRSFDGKSAYVLEVIPRIGERYFEYFDVQTGLLIGTEQFITTLNGESTTITRLSDYRAFDDILLPTTMTQELPGGQTMVTRVVTIEHGTVARARMARPAIAAEPSTRKPR